MRGIHYLAGGNTARGFHSCFDSILPQARQKRMYFLKGGPGVGKSTLMKRFAAAAEERGIPVEYFHCASDPDSLDGVSLPTLGIGMLDGTAPHICDPAVPGARDTLISLGDFLDEKALAPRAGQIAAIQREIAARFARCRRYLAASEQVLSASHVPEDPAKAEEICDRWTRDLPMRGGTGTVRRLFASAFTPEGLLDVTDLARFERRFTVALPFGGHATGLLRGVARRAARRGLNAVQLLDPLLPEQIAHVLIPEHGLAFCTARAGEKAAGECLEADALFELPGEPEDDRLFDRETCALLWRRAAGQLSAARELHGELERIYTRGMDFGGWQSVLDGLLDTLG